VSVDWLATQGMRASDMALTRMLASRAASSPITATELAALQAQHQGLVGRGAEWWLNRRGLIIVYRGQQGPTTRILSPLAREQGVPASEALVARARALGLSDSEIAQATARWHTTPLPRGMTVPELVGEPVGAVGLPVTRIPGVAADFGGPEGVVYVIRLPQAATVRVPNWGLAVENEWVVFNELPQGSVVRMMSARRIPALTVDDVGRIIPATRGD
jgi:hypothetical protein